MIGILPDLPTKFCAPGPRFLPKCQHRYRIFPPVAAEYEFFDTTITLLLCQLYRETADHTTASSLLYYLSAIILNRNSEHPKTDKSFRQDLCRPKNFRH
ncbi:hypothetical protein AVDCRST_MAG84-7641 [uncultured Microcoleus sp.]|uniref:Uncharacterized protein n=1 Tax=uncultured Microcoleus sp. TaxID=259945 RepID=A0A6J4PXU9_9CYAN|nr:hypothetical protein AVDCRST_MAG84-7641 [uncultured Microcoleus sp.]